MEAASVEGRIGPVEIAALIIQITIFQLAIDEYGFIDDERATSKLLISNCFHGSKSESNHDALISACGPILRTGTGERLAFAEAMVLALMVATFLTG